MTDASTAHPRRGLALALLASTQFVLILDAAIVSVALPSIGDDLAFAREDLSWVANAYTLMFGGFLLLGGRVADLLGRRRLFIAGLILFSLASLGGALAQSTLWLVVARGRPGPRCGAGVPGRPVARDDAVPGGLGAQQGARRLGRRGRVRRRRRRHPRRPADRVARLAGGAVRERPDRGCRGAARHAPAARGPRGGRDAGVRRRRRGLGDGRPRAAGLRARGRQRRGLGLGSDARARRGRAGAAGVVRRDRVAREAARWSRSGSSPTAHSEARTWSASR